MVHAIIQNPHAKCGQTRQGSRGILLPAKPVPVRHAVFENEEKCQPSRGALSARLASGLNGIAVVLCAE